MPEPSSRPTAAERLRTAVILCASADEAVRIAYWLESAAIAPLVALDGYAADRALRRDRVVALITDRVLPPWPGLDSFVSLRRTHHGLHVVYIGDGAADGNTLAAAAGASRILTRPLRRRAVLAALLPEEIAA